MDGTSQGLTLMAKRTSRTGKNHGSRKASVQTYRHEGAKRTNDPPAKIAAEGTVPAVPKARYAYSPRRPPTLRPGALDESGRRTR